MSDIHPRIAAATTSILDTLKTGTTGTVTVYYDDDTTRYTDSAVAGTPAIPAKPSSTQVKKCLQAFVDQEDVDDLTKRYLLGAIEDLCETFNAFYKTLVQKHKTEYRSGVSFIKVDVPADGTTPAVRGDRLNSGSSPTSTWTDKTADTKYTGSWDKLYDDFAEEVMTHPLYIVLYYFERIVWTGDEMVKKGGLLSWMHYLYQYLYNKDAARVGTVTNGGTTTTDPLPNTVASDKHIADRKWALYGVSYLFTRRLTGASNTISSGSPPLRDWWTSTENGQSACWELALSLQEHYLTREPELCPETGLLLNKEKATGCPSDQFCWEKLYVYIAGGAFGLILVLMLVMMVR